MGAEYRFGKEVVEDQVIFVGVGGDQVIHPALPLESLQFFLIAGGVDDGPDPVIDQNRVAKGVLSPPNEFYRAFREIVHGFCAALPGKEFCKPVNTSWIPVFTGMTE